MSLSLHEHFNFSLGTGDPVDYTSSSGNFDYQPGGVTQCVEIPVNDDALQEPTERFLVDFFLDPFVTPAAIASVDIRDNDQIGNACSTDARHTTTPSSMFFVCNLRPCNI